MKQVQRSDARIEVDVMHTLLRFFLTYYCAHNGLSLGPSLYFVIHSYHAQTMTHTPTIADSLLVHLLVVSAL
jgi:hypothetical protein